MSSKKTKKNPDELQREEDAKKLLMWAGVIFFMTLISLVWVVNTKKVFHQISIDNQSNSRSWQEMKSELGTTMNEFKKQFDELGASFKETESLSLGLGGLSTTSDNGLNNTKNTDKTDALIKKLEKNLTDSSYVKATEDKQE